MRKVHKAIGDPCAFCKLPAAEHEGPTTPSDSIQHQIADSILRGSSRNSTLPSGRKTKKEAVDPDLCYIGIDGEGQGRKHHAYVFIGASNFDGTQTWGLEDKDWRKAWTPCKLYPESCDCRTHYTDNVKGLSTVECLDFILFTIPDYAKLFSFSFGYDLTKILTDVDNRSLYRLFRPELRQRKGSKAALGPKPVLWNGYSLNLQGTKFTVSKDGVKKVIWDIFKFYGCKFVSSLQLWNTGSPELHERMTVMKDKRDVFDKEDPDGVVKYCLEECQCMAIQAKKLTDAHNAVDLPLKAYHGAGSSAAAMLKLMGVKEKIKPLPQEMFDAIARAFFGGRFENSAIGPIREQLWNYDISSAYPFQIYFLPCLEHGRWRRTENRNELDSCSHALVRYGFDPSASRKVGGKKPVAWGPFPYRISEGAEKGSICFPHVSGGGWVYRAEFLAGEKLFDHVRMQEAWIYETECQCKPFDKIPYYYLYRILLGKEGPGITIKLAVNSCYGKLAQSIGNALFNCWLWAGMITSGCRAQILQKMGEAYSLDSILMIATDGICSRERLTSTLTYDKKFGGDMPLNTGSAFLLDPATKQSGTVPNPKPLGGWEEKLAPKGMFLARPGIYFPLYPDEEEIAEIKGRGVGKKVILDNSDKILMAWLSGYGSQSVKVANVSRFCGAKTSISRSGKPGNFSYNRASGAEGPTAPCYGQWISRSVELGFDPLPKRKSVMWKHPISNGFKLKMRVMGSALSMPYDRVTISKEAQELKVFTQIALEQPDIDFSEFSEEVGL